MRDKITGKWRRRHPALRSRLLGAINRDNPVVCRPREGLRLVFDGGQTVMTSTVQVTGRPCRESVFWYTSLCRTGEITTSAALRSRAS